MDTGFMPTSDCWIRKIEDACCEEDWAASNRAITRLHYGLSEALAEVLGRGSGPNFHTWAVWGSRKAGETIRQQDLDSAIRNATFTAGLVGGLAGALAGVYSGRRLSWTGDKRNAALGAGIGAAVGAWTGREIAIVSRRRAAKVVLDGNRLVLRDIGAQSARFLEMLERGATSHDRRRFFEGLRPGRTEDGGQDRLASAFASYLQALDASDLREKQEAMIAGNCAAVYHEHIRLEPYIRRAMPWIVRRCATQRMMTYEIGEKSLTVREDVPGCEGPTAARDWTRLRDRMRYVFALFRQFHGEPTVFAAPD